MFRSAASGVWVKIAAVGAVVWLFYAAGQIIDPEGETSLEATFIRIAVAAVGALVIVGLGLIFQWLSDYIQERRDRID